jgi:hypothetical protein
VTSANQPAGILSGRAASAPLALTLALMAMPAIACMSDQSGEEIAEGKLSIASKRDAAGRPEKPYILTLPAPACLSAKDPEDSVKSTRTIHIFSSHANVHAKIGRLVGKTVLVRGKPFAAHTAHHHAPIVMDISEIDSH